MRLPNGDAATISEDKVVRYLLSSSHPSGKDKAAFFTKHGFTSSHWRVLAVALRTHASENPLVQETETPYGTHYVVDGPMAAPDGTELNVRSVWFINRGMAVPRFATAHPLKRKSR